MNAYEEELVKLQTAAQFSDANSNSTVSAMTGGLVSNQRAAQLTAPQMQAISTRRCVCVEVPRIPTQLHHRSDFLVRAIDECHAKIAVYDAERRRSVRPAHACIHAHAAQM